jgi:DNA repair photolyase
VEQTKTSFPTIQEILSTDPSRSVWSAVLEQNRHNKQLMMQIMDHQIKKSDFKRLASERNEGQWAWGMTSYNIRDPKYLCKHACPYCYIGPMFKRFGHVCQPVPMEDMMPVNQKTINKSWTPVSDLGQRKMVFFPSSSDIFVENAKDYVQVCLKILKSGHEVMFVTKPTLGSVRAIAHEMEQTGEMDLFRSKMAIFITITTNDPKLLKYLEPNASSYPERLEVIIELRQRGFHVNIMMEPYFSDPLQMIKELESLMDQNDPNWVIAIGKLNYGGHMQLNPDPEVDCIIKNQLEKLYTPDNLLSLWEVVKNDPHLFFKKENNSALLKLV